MKAGRRARPSAAGFAVRVAAGAGVATDAADCSDGPGGAGDAAGVGDSAAPEMCRSTSSFVTRPEAPVPCTAARSTSACSAIRRASGVAFGPSAAAGAA